MNLYTTLLCFIFTLNISNQKANKDLEVVKKGLGSVTVNSVGLILFVDVNNTSQADYAVELVPDRCCLKEGDLDCNILEIIGDCVQIIPRGKVARLDLVIPLIDLYERFGHCDVYLDSKDVNNKRNVMRNNVKIPFDSRIQKLEENLPYEAKKCYGIDEDPLNNCSQVNCATYYNDKKPYYDEKLKRCTPVPACLSDVKNFAISVYDSITNICIDDPITKEDIDYIKQEVKREKRAGKHIIIIKKHRNMTNDSNINNVNDRDFVPSFAMKNLSPNVQNQINSLLCALSKSKYGLIGLLVLVFIQCTLILYCFFCRRVTKKKIVEDKNYNGRNEASITTPLMGLTNDTETTKQCNCNPSDMYKKILNYKACQKGEKDCLSDDVLEKCVSRRDWNRNRLKSDEDGNKNVFNICRQSNYKTLYCTKMKKSPTITVENEDKRRPKNIVKKKALKTSWKRVSPEPKKQQEFKDYKERPIKEYGDSDTAYSEQELRCFSYKNEPSKTTYTDATESSVLREYGKSEREINCHSYSDGSSSRSYTSKSVKTSKEIQAFERESKHASGDKQASVQASFPNDSIDEFLSERGMIFLAEETSKFTFSDKSLLTNSSSKTSKRNIIRNVISYFKKKKKGALSDSGAYKKIDEDKKMELIHMSRASVYSSNNGKSLGERKSTTSL